MGLVNLGIAAAIVRDIILHGFINSILLLLQKRTYLIQEAIRPIAMREDFAELHQFLQHQEGLRETIEADLSYRNVTTLKVILEYSINQLDFSFEK